MRFVWIIAAVLVTAAIVLGAAYVAFPPFRMLLPSPTPDPSQYEESSGRSCASREAQCTFARQVLGSLEDKWRPIVERDGLRQGGGGETEFDTPTLAVFDSSISTPCGDFGTAFGPFYCSTERFFYVDLAWMDWMAENAPGDMGQAIIIAHEYAHWLQDKSGVGPFVRRFIEFGRPRAPEMSVRYELQADCLAGVWGALARDDLRIDDADVREALNVMHFTGSDAYQQRAGRDVDMSGAMHGTSEQRMRWMRRGFESNGDPAACDTFAVPLDQL